MLEVYVKELAARERCIRYMADYSPATARSVASRSYFVAEDEFFRADEQLLNEVDARPIAYNAALTEVMELTAADRRRAAELLVGDYSDPAPRPEDVHRLHIERDGSYGFAEPPEEPVFTVRWDGLQSYPHDELLEAMAAATTISQSGMQTTVLDESTGAAVASYHLADTLYLHPGISDYHDPERVAF